MILFSRCTVRWDDGSETPGVLQEVGERTALVRLDRPAVAAFNDSRDVIVPLAHVTVTSC